jgi:hypothetical protein
MGNKTIILVIPPDVKTDMTVLKMTPECYGNLKKVCEAYGWKYNTICRKGDSFIKDGYRVYRVALM